MATPLSSGQALRAAKSTGHRVVQLSGWATHNRNHKGAWGPANGVMVHHTGSDTSAPAAYATNVLHDGYSGLPGPLCQFGIDADGVIYMIGWGRANHAGRGDDAVLDRVMKEDPRLMDAEARPVRRGTDGNPRFYGIEVMYSGGHRMTGPQRDSTESLAAALCRAHGWGAASVIAHREWSTTKWDPGQESMVTMRRNIAARLQIGDVDMASSEEIAGAILRATVTHPTTGEEVTIREALRMGLVGKIEAAEANAGVRVVRADVGELTGAVSALVVALGKAETL